MKNFSFSRVKHSPTHRATHSAMRGRRLVRWILGLAALLFVTLGARDFLAQQPPPSPAQPQAQQPPAAPQQAGQSQPALKRPEDAQAKIAVEVKTVSVLATVRDTHGKIVSDLTQDDFQLDEDGRPQIHSTYFVHESGRAAAVGPVGGHQPQPEEACWIRERTASYSFLDKLFAPGQGFCVRDSLRP